MRQWRRNDAESTSLIPLVSLCELTYEGASGQVVRVMVIGKDGDRSEESWGFNLCCGTRI